MRRYRKRPVVVEAVQFWDSPKSVTAISELAGRAICVSYVEALPVLHIETLEGTMTAREGDWIIRGVRGELYPCKPDIFDATYEPADFPEGCERRPEACN